MLIRLIKTAVIYPFCLCISAVVYSQVNSTLSSKSSSWQQMNDSVRVEFLVNRSKTVQPYKPDSALIYAQQALSIARSSNDKKGEANSLNRLGVVLWKNGKYDSALEFLLSSLKIREESNDRPGELACLNNIGIVYSDQNDNEQALKYHFKAKGIAESLNDKKFLSIVLSNIGNCYVKLNKVNSALTFEMRAYGLQQAISEKDMLPNTLSILGDINYKLKHQALALDYYRTSVSYAVKINDQSGIADTYNSMASLIKNSSEPDSGIFYATRALAAAETAIYPIGIYNAANLLTELYQHKNEHLELVYLKTAMAAKDSMFNAEKIKQIQLLSFNEAARQQEIIEKKRRELVERIINLQLLGIAIFIPFFFLVLLILRKSRTHRKVIEFMGVLSLLLVFEFITLFIHPFVQRISNHLPVLELFILVILAAVLVPLHHRMTHWMRKKLVHHHNVQEGDDTESTLIKNEPQVDT